MTTEFAELGATLMTALVESDSGKRQAALEKWVESAIPILQGAIPDQLRSYVQELIQVAEQPDGWKPPAKWHNGIFNLSMDVRASHKGYRWLPPDPSAGGPPPEPKPAEANLGGSGGSTFRLGGRSDPSRNDQRSNVMNPNNPASSAATNNRNNQMNPNNPAYRSSRGGGRRR